jgi:hypothetical protein
VIGPMHNEKPATPAGPGASVRPSRPAPRPGWLVRSGWCALGRWTACLVMVVLLSPLEGMRAQTPYDEYDVKAAFLHKFAMFVEWPTQAFAQAQSPIVIATLGTDPFGSKLDRVMAGKTAQGRPVVVQRFSEPTDAVRSGCHLLFIASSEKGRVQAVVDSLGNLPIVTVGDVPGYGEKGVMINLIQRGSTLRFEIDRQTAAQAGVKLSSQLLDLAIKVRDQPKARGPKP